jgi:hypothetical protein
LTEVLALRRWKQRRDGVTEGLNRRIFLQLCLAPGPHPSAENISSFFDPALRLNALERQMK